MARMSIYVSDALKAQMDEIGDDRVNWSAAAQEAFERQVERNQWPKGSNMELTIERLRASKQAYIDKEAGEGFKHGQEWAAKTATFQELKKMSALDLDDYAWADEWTFDRRLDHYLKDGESLEAFEERFFFDGTREIPADEYVKAFVDGAQAIWTQVADKL